MISEFALRAKSSDGQGGVRTRELARNRDEGNHQTKRLTSTIRERTCGFLIKLREHFFQTRVVPGWHVQFRQSPARSRSTLRA